MPRIAIGPETCGLNLKPAGLRELRQRRGKGTWFYEAVCGVVDPVKEKRHVLVTQAEEGLPEHSHARPYDAYLGYTLTNEEMILAHGHAVYPTEEARDRTAADLVDMVEFPQPGWFFSPVKVVDVPDDVEWFLFEGEDGSESVHESHRVWS